MIAIRSLMVLALVGASLGLGACGEKAQTMEAGARKSTRQAYEGGENATQAAKGWKPGDRASWEAQMRTRAQLQNEYNRTK